MKFEKLTALTIIHVAAFVCGFSIGVGLVRDFWGTLATLGFIGALMWAVDHV